MNTVFVKAEREYEIQVGVEVKTVIRELSAKHTKVVLFLPAILKDKFSRFAKSIPNILLYVVEEGELAKDISSIDKTWKFLGKHNISRDDALIALGGGTTTDSVGFIAATWLRGITWYAMPSTLAGAVDAAIGGKTGINSRHGKNMIGAFYSPAGVYIDTTLLTSVSKRDIRAGMAEVIKTGFIADNSILELLSKNPEVDKSNLDLLGELIVKSATVKARVVSQDFTESKLREILNYGHTLGHAIEKQEKYQMRHGEAISLGLIYAAKISELFADLDGDTVALHRMLLEKYHLPTKYSPHKFDQLFELMQSDKKNRKGQVRYIGLSSIANPVWLEDLNAEQFRLAYQQAFGA
jgi:3-dehydroquinate synthase